MNELKSCLAEGIVQLYKKPARTIDDEVFYAKATNPETNIFYQTSDLPLEYRKKSTIKQNLSA